LRNDEAFSTWLFTIARNVIISHGRKRYRETAVDPDVLREIAPSTASVEGDILLREELTTVTRLLRGFAQREQDIISLKFDAELTNSQIAEIMELGEPNVRVILFRTLRKLRAQMAAEERA
jgi:RNA polymerase sigma-70 factor (ECF subfamily)